MSPTAPSSFKPSRGLRSAFLQSALASKRPARWLWQRRGLNLDAQSERKVFSVHDEDGTAVTLAGYYTPQAQAKSLVVLIHGWEGDHRSNYLYGMACTLFSQGHAIFRLNMRDHGDSHALNEGLFHSARLQEVLEAIQAAQALAPALPLFVIGFSLGGNFALRAGMKGPAHGLHPKMCIGISPAINPLSTLKGIDGGPKIVNRYFLDKWRDTMDAKARAWPGRYDFTRQKLLNNFVDITRAFVEDYTPYPTLEHYLGEYTLSPQALMASPVPLAIFTAADDSVCPPADFAGLHTQAAVHSHIVTPHGGHCGFIENWRLDCWVEGRVAELLQQQLTTP